MHPIDKTVVFMLLFSIGQWVPIKEGRWQDVKRTEKIIVTSLKGGVGKSTVSTSVAASMAEEGLRVLLADLDFRSRSLELMTGTCDKVIFNLYDYMAGRADAERTTVRIPVKDGEIMFCPAPDEDVLGPENGPVYEDIPGALKKLTDESGADVVICDSGAESFVPRMLAKEFATMAIVVSGQSRTAIRAAEITAQKLAAAREGLDVRLVINDFDVSLANLGVRAGLLQMIDECSVRCVGVYPHDEHLPSAQDRGVLLPEGITSVAARNTAARILGDSVPLFRGLGKLRSKIRL